MPRSKHETAARHVSPLDVRRNVLSRQHARRSCKHAAGRIRNTIGHSRCGRGRWVTRRCGPYSRVPAASRRAIQFRFRSYCHSEPTARSFALQDLATWLTVRFAKAGANYSIPHAAHSKTKYDRYCRFELLATLEDTGLFRASWPSRMTIGLACSAIARHTYIQPSGDPPCRSLRYETFVPGCPALLAGCQFSHPSCSHARPTAHHAHRPSTDDDTRPTLAVLFPRHVVGIQSATRAHRYARHQTIVAVAWNAAYKPHRESGARQWHPTGSIARDSISS